MNKVVNNKKWFLIIDIFVFGIFNYYVTTNPFISFLWSVIFVIVAYSFRAYDSLHLKELNEQFLRNLVSICITALIILFFYPLLENYLDRYLFFYNFFFAVFFVSFLHYILYKIFFKYSSVKEYLVIGRMNEIGSVLSEIEKKSFGKIKFKEYINPTTVELEAKLKIYTNVLIADPLLEDMVRPQLYYFKQQGCIIEYLPDLSEKVLKRIPIEVVEKFKDYYLLKFETNSTFPLKRFMDIVVALIGLVIFSPLIFIVSIAILIEDGFPIIFKQQRIGKNGKPFELWKLRSLKDSEIDPNNPNNGIEKRILKIGKVSRKSRIDESLQFINVLKGTMSIVGTRPEMIEFHNQMKDRIPFYNYRNNVNPGITGWAQINYKHTSNLEDYKMKTEYDLYYVKNQSLFLDIKIMLQTLEAMIGMRGAR